jgi:hypothetical protein
VQGATAEELPAASALGTGAGPKVVIIGAVAGWLAGKSVEGIGFNQGP